MRRKHLAKRFRRAVYNEKGTPTCEGGYYEPALCERIAAAVLRYRPDSILIPVVVLKEIEAWLAEGRE